MTWHLAHARSYPCDVETAFARVVTVPLPDVFGRRYGPIAPITDVRDQQGTWGTRLGQTRTVVSADRSRLHETLTALDPPHVFDYRLDDVGGPLALLFSSVDGAWRIEPAGPRGDGVRVTWTWDVTPTPVGAPLRPVVARLWQGFARQGFEELGRVLA